jgi:hypothetical protein
LEQPVADHALSLGTDHVQRIGLSQLAIIRALNGQEADLGSVPVRNDELVVSRDIGQFRHRVLDVMALD